MNYFNLLQLKIMKHFESICKLKVFWDLKHCMHHIVNYNLLRYVNAV